MNASVHHQLLQLDRALLALLDERARLCREAGHEPRAALDDLLRRHTGPIAAAHVRAVLASVDQACAAALEAAQ